MIELSDLNNTFVTADNHFGHENIIKFCDRPFQSVEEMDQALIDNWNSVIGKDDIVYHLGDFTLGDITQAAKYFSQLNGNILVLGNHWHHDKRWLPKNYFGALAFECAEFAKELKHVQVVPPMVVLEIKGMGNEGRPLPITLCHYPLEVWDRSHYGAWHLCAHTHKQDTTGKFRLNIGVDCTNYYPESLGGVLESMYEMGWG